MNNKWQDLTIALAGLFQALSMVETVAKTGQVPASSFKTSIESLLNTAPTSPLDVYGNNLANLHDGLIILRTILTTGQKQYADVLRYSLGVLHLQKKLSKDKNMLAILAERLSQTSRQAEHFSSTHDNVIANIGGIYSDTISTFPFRIQVSGDYNFLQQPRIAAQVRALLFAGIRSATLWRQLGGNRWQLLFGRKKLLATVDQLLKEAQ